MQRIVHALVRLHTLIKFLANKNVKIVEILGKLRAQFGEETLSKAQMHNGSRLTSPSLLLSVSTFSM